MELKSLDDVLADQLRDLWSVEEQLVMALPRMVMAADSEKLAEVIGKHLDETRNHVVRLVELFGALRIAPPTELCQAMERILSYGEEVVSSTGDAIAKDAALIAVAQHVEHYEIAGYATATRLAGELGLDDASLLLAHTLSEEKNADERLGKLALVTY